MPPEAKHRYQTVETVKEHRHQTVETVKVHRYRPYQTAIGNSLSARRRPR